MSFEFNNYTGDMQEFLQRKAPHLGCHCQDLWTHHVEVYSSCFRARVILLNTNTEENLKLPLSASFVSKKDAKQDASRLALEWMRMHKGDLTFKSGCFVLSESRTQLYLDHQRSNNPSDLVDRDTVFTLPENASLFPKDFDVVYRLPGLGMSSPVDALEDEKYEANSDIDISIHGIGPSKLNNPTIPHNLGSMGEMYAVKWLQSKLPSHDRGRVTRTDREDGNPKPPYDIEISASITKMDPLKEFGSFIEVKTNWGKGQANLSRDQSNVIARDPCKHTILHIKYFQRLFNETPSCPQIRLIVFAPPCEEEDDGEDGSSDFIFRPAITKPATTHQHCSVISIPRTCVGHVIGKGGKNIKQIVRDTSCKIHVDVSKDDPDIDTYQLVQVHLSGRDRPSLSRAKKAIFESCVLVIPVSVFINDNAMTILGGVLKSELKIVFYNGCRYLRMRWTEHSDMLEIARIQHISSSRRELNTFIKHNIEKLNEASISSHLDAVMKTF